MYNHGWEGNQIHASFINFYGLLRYAFILHPVAVLMLGNSVDQTLKATTIALGADRQTHHQHSVLDEKGNYLYRQRIQCRRVFPFTHSCLFYTCNNTGKAFASQPDLICGSVVTCIYKLCFSVMSRWVICVQKTKNTERD